MRRSSHDAHTACVAAWLAPAERDVERLVSLLDEGLTRIWHRATLTLGEATMHAIADRVMHDAARRHPVLEGMALGSDGIGAEDLRRRDPVFTWETVQPLAHFLLTELMAVIGSLTADILTSALHAELAEPPAVPSEATATGRRGSGDQGTET